MMRSFSAAAKLQDEEQGKLIPEAAVKAKLREMNSLKSENSLWMTKTYRSLAG